MYLLFFKRPLDVIGSVLVIILFSWLFILIALLYVSTFQFPFFFHQHRIGRFNRVFTIHKFRTLSSNESLDLPSRRFWVGDLLRFLSLDELPQVWNILKGEMSWIGPRPLPAEYLILMNGEQKSRHDVRPGITGLVQISNRHQISWYEKFRLDKEYVSNVSLKVDCKIILKTITRLLSPGKDVSLMEQKFTGN